MSVEFDSVIEIENTIGIQPNGYWNKRLAEKCKDHMQRFVPKKIGTLRRTAFIENNSTIVYPQEYASYQYHGMRHDGTHIIKKWSEPGSGPYWDKRMESADMEQIVDDLNKEIGGARYD